jgi:diguanylate cyclase (GGDEF)-like protein
MRGHKNRRILVIDDQKSIHEDYRKVMAPARECNVAVSEAAISLFGEDSAAPSTTNVFEVDSAYQGEEGFRMVQKAQQEGRPYALAFVDVRMPPGWDGVDTVQRIWEIDPEILVVICSAYSDYSWEQMVHRLGPSDRFLVLKKPFEQIEVRQFAAALTERWNLARNDVLTGLLNRRAFSEHLHREQSRAARYGTPLACAMLDLDYFKRINDEFGHATGDAVLKSVAELLEQETRASDYVCRFGGEELSVLLPQIDENGARDWAEKVRLAIANRPFAVRSDTIKITVSIGVAAMNSTQSDAESLVELADAALRAAKLWGRNRVVVHSILHASDNAAGEPVFLESPLEGVSAAEVMTKSSPLIHGSAKIAEAANLLLRHRMTSLPVIDEAGLLIGVISEKEIMPQMVLPQGSKAKVSEFMRADVIAYSEDTPVDRVFDFLSRVTIGQVFVVRDGRPVGAITRGGLLRWLSHWLSLDVGRGAEIPSEATAQSRAHIREAAQDLAYQAALLSEDLAEDREGGLPPVLEVMFKMQELMNDLIACSQKSWPLVDQAIH